MMTVQICGVDGRRGLVGFLSTFPTSGVWRFSFYGKQICDPGLRREGYEIRKCGETSDVLDLLTHVPWPRTCRRLMASSSSCDPARLQGSIVLLGKARG
jgi:hypothetical protein